MGFLGWLVVIIAHPLVMIIAHPLEGKVCGVGGGTSVVGRAGERAFLIACSVVWRFGVGAALVEVTSSPVEAASALVEAACACALSCCALEVVFGKLLLALVVQQAALGCSMLGPRM